MYSLGNKSSKPGFSEKIKQELKREDKQGRSYLLLTLLILLGVALLFFLIALARGCGGEETKEAKTKEPAAQEEVGEEQTSSDLEEGGTSEEATSEEGQTYEVQSGDTLSSIGAKLEVSWKKIAEVNNLSAPYDLKVGDKLIIPPKESEETSTSGSEDSELEE